MNRHTQGAPCHVPGPWDLQMIGVWGPDITQSQAEPSENALSLPRDPEFVFYDQLKQVMNAYR